MRLINLGTLELEELNDDDLPKYAILSHTWEREEVAYKDWPAHQNGSSHLEGYKKILGFRDAARSIYHCKYGWVDTCCIDKSSSAELTEAINSMYTYYTNAAVCIAYLSDVECRAEDVWSSRWMTRGWTLQELIAPSRLEFYGSAWRHLGHLSGDLAIQLEGFTGIPREVLTKHSPPTDWSVAQRMSWASRRQTTRLEDRAYCLLGLFDVSLPLIYGEGERAFVRLQEEIIARSTDHSIFAWHFRGSLSRKTAPDDSVMSLSATPGLSLPASSHSMAYRSVNKAEAPQDHEGLVGEPPSLRLDIEGLPTFTNPHDRDDVSRFSTQPCLPARSTSSDAARRLLAPSPSYFWDCDDVVECYQDVKGWVESYDMNNLGLGSSLPLVACTSQVGLYHAVLNCRFRHRHKGPIALNLKRTSQSSTRLQHVTHVDFETTTFGVVRTNDVESSRFRCSADHLDRLAIVEEEALISCQKTRVTVLRICSPSLTINAPRQEKKVRLASVRAPKGLRPFQPGRLKVNISDDCDTHAQRTNALPKDEWDTTSHIWFVNSPVAGISFAWERHPSELTFLFATGTERDTPYHIALLEKPRTHTIDYGEILSFQRTPAMNNEYELPSHAHERWENRLYNGYNHSRTEPLRIGRSVKYELPFATIEVRMERPESMSKIFHQSTITIIKQQLHIKDASQSLPPIGVQLQTVQHRGKVESQDTDDADDKLNDGIPFTIQEEVIDSEAKKKGLGRDGTMSLRRQFSFEQ